MASVYALHRIDARPVPAATPGAVLALRPGLHRIEPATQALGRRPAWLEVPPGLDALRPAPLLVMLHGSGGEPQQGLSLLEPLAAESGVAVLSPAAAAYTWDGVLGRSGPDMQGIDHALQWTFERLPVDPRRIAIGGFSDGASYALALGIGNGDLFSRVLALSPGFIPAVQPHEQQPSVFLSHGTADRVLPIARCGRVIVTRLRRAGYDVDYREFVGGHEVPADIASAAVAWLLR